MQWRFLKLNWPYAIGELLIVTMGVLIALAINEWNNDRLERAEEVLILERLVSDLQSDVAAYQLGLEFLEKKEESLRRLQSVLKSADSRPNDLTQFLQDVIYSTTYGWNQHRARRTTIDELLGSGKLGLIRNADVRAAVGEYYELDKGMHGRIDERETRYPRISYQLVPRANEYELDPSLDDEQIESLVAGVFESSLREHVIGEINFARFVREMFVELQSKCTDLIMALQAYLEAEHQA
jgi:hypothetical protein